MVRRIPFAIMVLFLAGLAGVAVGQTPPKLTKLQTEDVKVGKGLAVGPGDTLFVLYVGALVDGSVFDRNDGPKGTPLTMVIGKQPLSIIKGWDVGLRGMKVGGVRRLRVPSDMGYGPQGNDKIPANSDLFFEVTLLDAIRKGEEDMYDSTDLVVGKGAVAKKGSKVTVNYTARLVNGKLVDSTYKRKKPVEFTLGVGQAVIGIDAGMPGMRVGGKRRLRLPPRLLGNSSGSAFFPPGSIVVYEIELVKIR